MLRAAHERGEVTPLMTAGDRGRLPDHIAQPLVAALGGVMQRERRALRAGARKRAARLARSRRQISAALVRHWRSYDKVNRPVTMLHPAQRFSGHTYLKAYKSDRPHQGDRASDHAAALQLRWRR